MNHFAQDCRSTRPSQPSHRPLRRSSNFRTSRINQVDAEPFLMPTPESPPNSNDDDYLFTLDSPAQLAKTLMATVKILNKNVQMIVDTGTSTDILDKKTFDSLTRDDRVTLNHHQRVFLHMVQIPLCEQLENLKLLQSLKESLLLQLFTLPTVNPGLFSVIRQPVSLG